MRKFSMRIINSKRISKADTLCSFGNKNLYGFGNRKRNYERALTFFIKALDAGSIRAPREIGKMYEYGYGFNKNKIEATKWYRRGVELGDAQSMQIIADFLVEGIDAGIDLDETINLFKKLAYQGNREAMYFLAEILLGCKESAQNESEALKWLTKYNDGNELAAMENLGYFYFAYLPDTTENKLKALHWYEKIAESDPSFGFQIGEMYLNGQGVEKNPNTAFEWFKKTAENGNDNSMAKLAWFYLKGEFVPKDEMKALDWLTKFYKDKPIAMMFLALIYYWAPEEELPFDDETLTDKAKAFEWFQKVYDLNADDYSVSWAAGCLGRMYLNGEYVARDKAKALQFWKRGVELDNGACCRNIIKMYLSDDEKNIPEAINWTIKYFTTESKHFCRCAHCSPLRELRELAKFFIESDAETIVALYDGNNSVAADTVCRFAMACVDSPLKKNQTIALAIKSAEMGSLYAKQLLLDKFNFEISEKG